MAFVMRRARNPQENSRAAAMPRRSGVNFQQFIYWIVKECMRGGEVSYRADDKRVTA